MLVLPIISIVCCIIYILYIVFSIGVPVSLSETFYLLPKKRSWMFSAWCVLTSMPLGIWWFIESPKYLSWIPVIVCISLLLVGSTCDYKSNFEVKVADTSRRRKSNKTLKDKIKEIIKSLSWKNIVKHGLAKPIHYFVAIQAIILSTVYICLLNPSAIYSTIFLYVMFICIGLKVPGKFNPNMSLDVDNSSWIFFMEVICFINLFIFIW